MQQEREPVRELARGKWPALLGKFLDERALAGKHTKCPSCGGSDRFRFDNKEGAGTWICSHDGAGDGFSLLQLINGWTFPEAARYVEDNAGRFRSQPIKQERLEGDVRQELRNLWEGALKLKEGDPVMTYLHNRCGITVPPLGLRHHPALPYFHEDKSVTTHPAMLAQVIGYEGAPLSIHRTYLTPDGKKADVPTAKKLMTPVRKLENAAIRMMKPNDGWIGVAEGIETALAAAMRHKVPVWACVTAGIMETFRPPEGVSLVVVFGDNDASFTGQASAYKLARAIVALGVECKVCIPEVVGTDWADVPKG